VHKERAMTSKHRKRPGVEQCLTILLERLDAIDDKCRALKRSLQAGTVKRAIDTALDIEPLLREANQALQAACLLWREDRQAGE
jgi:hypothetical protein